jgi:NAD(P)-dependent dehydrogenase (short-subunit alcohol dehydrogenase family)
MNAQKIEGAVALVTGANRGIGRALTEALLTRGVKKVYVGTADGRDHHGDNLGLRGVSERPSHPRGGRPMCPVCLTTTALVVAGTTSGAGVLGFVAVKFRWLQRLRRRTVLRWIRRKQ